MTELVTNEQTVGIVRRVAAVPLKLLVLVLDQVHRHLIAQGEISVGHVRDVRVNIVAKAVFALALVAALVEGVILITGLHIGSMFIMLLSPVEEMLFVLVLSLIMRAFNWFAEWRLSKLSK